MRLFGVLVALLPLSLASPFAPNPKDLDKRGSMPCSDRGVHIIASSGHGSTEYRGYGLLASTMYAIKAQIPHSTNSSTVYPKNDTDISQATGIGADNLSQYIVDYHKKCPNTPLVLFGYSEGAIITMNTLCGGPSRNPYNSAYSPIIIATVVYGDETRVPNQPYDLGTCTTGHGVNARNNPSGCDAFAANMQSYCDAPDPLCCGGNNQSVHYTYPATYNSDAASFIKSKWQAWKADGRPTGP